MKLKIGQLPFSLELFTNFIQDAIIDGEYDDSPYWIQLEDIITKQFDKKTFKIFTGWCEGYLEKQDQTIKEFYNSLSQIPLDRLNKALGAGSNGVVIDMGCGKVLKLYYSEEIKKCDQPFYNWCSKHESNVFPKVYKIGRNWVILEKLNTNTPDVELLFKLIDHSEYQGKTIYRWSKDSDIIPKGMSIEQSKALRWCLQCKVEMEDMKSKYIGWSGDLAIKNVGERLNGDIIFFDI